LIAGNGGLAIHVVGLRPDRLYLTGPAQGSCNQRKEKHFTTELARITKFKQVMPRIFRDLHVFRGVIEFLRELGNSAAANIAEQFNP
jgi:hypothetical protein